jgi:hypothetical protein
MDFATTWPLFSPATFHIRPPLGTWPTVASGPIAASYCSHTDDLGQVVFDPVYFGLYWDWHDHGRLEACLAMKRQLRLTDVVIAVQGGYGSYMDGATFDWRADPTQLHALAVWLLDRGFRPIVYVCTADPGTEVEIYDGTMTLVCSALVDLVDAAWFSIGWEVNKDRGGAFTAGQASDALLVCRAVLGDRAQLVWHGQPTRTTPASYYGSDYDHKPHADTPIRWVGTPDSGSWVDSDDPSDGNEMGAFHCGGFEEIDVIAYQTDHGANGPSYTTGGPGLDAYGQPRWWGRAIECLDRFLVPGTPMPGAVNYRWVDEGGLLHVHAGVSGAKDSTGYCPPDWFAAPRRRGRVTWLLLETVCYEYIRGGCSDAAVKRCTADATALGCQHQGCRQ